MRAILKQEIPVTDKALQHLDQCTLCLNCEAMCPSQVPFSQLISGTRQQLPYQTRSYWNRLIARLLTSPRLLRSSLSLLAYTPSWLQRVINIPIKPDSDNKTNTRCRAFYPASGQKTGQVQLFTGCMKDIDSANIHAAIRLLNHIGYDVGIPKGQTCCGSFHQHHGFQKQAQTLVQKNNTHLATRVSSPCHSIAPVALSYNTATITPGPALISCTLFTNTDHKTSPFPPVTNALPSTYPVRQKTIWDKIVKSIRYYNKSPPSSCLNSPGRVPAVAQVATISLLSPT